MPKRPRFGDVIAITTQAGTAYALYTHRDPMFGALLRVFARAPAMPQAPLAMASLPVQFSSFFPLGSACHRGIATILGNAPVPEDLQAFPTFRARMRGLTPESVSRWWLWDGEREWPVERLSSAEQDFPIREILNDTLLVERAMTGWRSADAL
jgi:hypothetical protein